MTEPHSPELNLRRILGSPTYLRAYEDIALLHRVEMRPVRIQLELMKAEIIQREEEIESTLVLFGGSRVPHPAMAAERVEAARARAAMRPDDPAAQRAVAVAEALEANSRYYEEARNLARLATESNTNGGPLKLVVSTGGGPGIMEAGNRGAHEAGGKSIGLNITLPHEQAPNPYITPQLCFQFHYFAIRKMHFLLRAKAAAFFPGGFGTLDELFETLTLVQTHKMKPIPLVLVGETFWRRLLDWDYLVSQGTISESDIDLFRICDTAEQAWNHIERFHAPKVLRPGDDPSEMMGAS